MSFIRVEVVPPPPPAPPIVPTLCTRLATNQIGEPGSLSEPDPPGNAIGEHLWQGQLSEATGVHQKFRYEGTEAGPPALGLVATFPFGGPASSLAMPVPADGTVPTPRSYFVLVVRDQDITVPYDFTTLNVTSTVYGTLVPIASAEQIGNFSTADRSARVTVYEVMEYTGLAHTINVSFTSTVENMAAMCFRVTGGAGANILAASSFPNQSGIPVIMSSASNSVSLAILFTNSDPVTIVPSGLLTALGELNLAATLKFKIDYAVGPVTFGYILADATRDSLFIGLELVAPPLIAQQYLIMSDVVGTFEQDEELVATPI